jgi:cell division protein FtsB
MLKKLIILGIVGIGIVVVYNFSHQVYDSLQAGSRLEGEVELVGKLQKHNEELKKQLSYAQTLEFLESQARNKLNMARPGETVMIVPESEIQKVLGVKIENMPDVHLPNWQGWLKLFSKN